MGRKPWACTWPGCGYRSSQEFPTLIHIDRVHLRAIGGGGGGGDPRAWIREVPQEEMDMEMEKMVMIKVEEKVVEKGGGGGGGGDAKDGGKEEETKK